MAFETLFSNLKSRLLGTQKPKRGLREQPQKMSAADSQMVENMLAGMTAQLQHEQQMIDTRGTEPMSVRLVP